MFFGTLLPFGPISIAEAVFMRPKGRKVGALMMKHLLAIALISTFTVPAHALKTYILEDGDQVPTCTKWDKTDEVVNLKKTFGPDASPCAEGTEPVKLRCASGEQKGLWKVRCE